MQRSDSVSRRPRARTIAIAGLALAAAAGITMATTNASAFDTSDDQTIVDKEPTSTDPSYTVTVFAAGREPEDKNRGMRTARLRSDDICKVIGFTLAREDKIETTELPESGASEVGTLTPGWKIVSHGMCAGTTECGGGSDSVNYELWPEAEDVHHLSASARAGVTATSGVLACRGSGKVGV